MRAVFWVLICLGFLNATTLEFLDSKVLKNPKINGLKFTEISDIAYDKKDDIFYALSDQGKVFTLRIEIKDKKIGKIKYLKGYRLRGKRGFFLPKRRRDSEGMALVGDKIWISFERRDRIDVYDKKFHFIRHLKLPKELKRLTDTDHSGDGFEALTYDKRFGFITAREYPFWQESKAFHTIYSSSGAICKIKRDKIKSSITEFEMLKDGSLLALFRKFSLREFKFVIKLKRIDILHPVNGLCKTEELVKLDLLRDKYVDNFEGLTHFKDDLYLIVSDDNDNIFQKTILRLIRIKL